MNKKNNIKKIIRSQRIYVLLVGSVLLLQTVIATNVSFSDQGTDTILTATGELLESGNLTIEVWDAVTGGNLMYNETFENAIINGSWNVMLGENPLHPLSLEFGEIYYRDYTINGEDINFTSYNGTEVDRQFFYSPLGSISEEDISNTTNLTLGERITFTLGEIIDNIFDGWIRITGGLNVTGDAIINGTLNVSGDINIQGNSLTINGQEVGTGTYFNQTGASYDANLSAGGYVGYQAANYICDQAFSGTHFCYESEIILTMHQTNISALADWSNTAWIATGGAKYSPADVPVNDCNGFTHGTPGTYLGSFWIFDQQDGGVGGVGHCGNTLPLACCKVGGAP